MDFCIRTREHNERWYTDIYTLKIEGVDGGYSVNLGKATSKQSEF
jgi:hypothetical protein